MDLADRAGNLYHLSRSRGFVTVRQTFPDGLSNATLVSDSWGAQLKTPAKRHQLCLAHLFREPNFFQEMFHIEWVTDIKDVGPKP